MPMKTKILLVKTNRSNQLIKPLHIAPIANQLYDAQHWVRASNVFILNHLLPMNFAEFVAKLADFRTRLYFHVCILLRWGLLNSIKDTYLGSCGSNYMQ